MSQTGLTTQQTDALTKYATDSLAAVRGGLPMPVGSMVLLMESLTGDTVLKIDRPPLRGSAADTIRQEIASLLAAQDMLGAAQRFVTRRLKEILKPAL